MKTCRFNNPRPLMLLLLPLLVAAGYALAYDRGVAPAVSVERKANFVHDKQGALAQRVAWFERLHRGW